MPTVVLLLIITVFSALSQPSISVSGAKSNFQRPPPAPQPPGGQVSASDDNVYEWLGLTYGQDAKHLAANLTIAGQVTTQSNYVLAGSSNLGYWYKAEVIWCDLICPGFEGSTQVWMSNGTNVLYSTQKWPLAADQDKVLLSLNFTTSGTVDLYAHDWNTGESDRFNISTFGANTFVGLQSNTSDSKGQFSGIETQQHFSTSFFGNSNEAIYDASRYPVQAAWMWISEYDYTTSNYVFYNRQPTNNSPTQFQYYAMNGTAEASSLYGFITGSPVVDPPTVSFQPKTTLLSGGSTTVASTFSTSQQTPLEVTDYYLESGFNNNHLIPSPFQSFNLTSSSTKEVDVYLTIPNVSQTTTSLRSFVSWKFFDPNSMRWLSSQTESYGNIPVEQTVACVGPVCVPTAGTSLWITVVLIAAVVSILTTLVFLKRRRREKPLKVVHPTDPSPRIS